MTLILAAQNEEGIVACYDTVLYDPNYTSGLAPAIVGYHPKVNVLPDKRTILGISGTRLPALLTSLKDNFPEEEESIDARTRAVEYFVRTYEDETNAKGGASYLLGLADDTQTKIKVYSSEKRKFIESNGVVGLGLSETTKGIKDALFDIGGATGLLTGKLEQLYGTIKNRINNFYKHNLVQGFGECTLTPKGYTLLKYEEK